ncbi:Chromodomain protein [Phytophthora cinnamomi]|uniref:Chromodomain protein n=1 Tax=Phytophthora cinnamomi TaxID=4785 RepID=UPI00355A8DEE|nr:Chromodomain protein [Phytophthora cinnamomi]
MSLDESSMLMDRALVTMCQDLPESLGLYNTAKDQFSLAAVRAVPLLEDVGPDSRKLALLRDWMRAYEPAEDQPLSTEISMDSLKETARRERKERERQLQEQKHALLTSAESDDRQRRKRQRKKEKAAAKEKERANRAKAKGKERAKPQPQKKKKSKDKQKSTRQGKTRAAAGGHKRHVQLDSDDDDVLSIDESSSTSESSSSESSDSSDSDSDNRSKKRKKPAASGNLPPKEVVLSSDEEDEPNEMFDTDDPDVYEVEKILRKKTAERYGDPDLYEVKWEGYDETTWEPASNISKDLIDEFEGQPVREDVYTVEDIVDRRSKRDPTTRLKTYQYKVKWVGYDELTWEPAENLPHNLRRKFDQKYENRKRRRS